MQELISSIFTLMSKPACILLICCGSQKLIFCGRYFFVNVVNVNGANSVQNATSFKNLFFFCSAEEGNAYRFRRSKLWVNFSSFNIFPLYICVVSLYWLVCVRFVMLVLHSILLFPMLVLQILPWCIIILKLS